MVAIADIRSQLTDLSRYGSGLVAVFVGGTSGIGETTAREFVRHTQKPRIYLIGRNEAAGEQLTKEFKQINPESEINFIQNDVSLLRNVGQVCEQIKSREERINLLCLSAGILTTTGRDEISEGLDKKFSLHYYSRMRFAQQLLPLVSKAAQTPTETGKQPLGRVISVLAGGLEKSVNLADFDLKKSFSLSACANHATTGNTLSFRTLAATPEGQGVTFVHSSPGFVWTNLSRGLPGWQKFLLDKGGFVLRPFETSIPESGERHLWQATTDNLPKGRVVLMSAKCEDNMHAKVDAMTKDGTQSKIWEHTLGVFKKICEEGGKY